MLLYVLVGLGLFSRHKTFRVRLVHAGEIDYSGMAPSLDLYNLLYSILATVVLG
jgi:hypothetical protein